MSQTTRRINILSRCQSMFRTFRLRDSGLGAPYHNYVLPICNSPGLSQEQLAEKANVSRSHISSIEAPGIARPFSLEVFFNIADALEIDPADLISASVFPDKIISSRKD